MELDRMQKDLQERDKLKKDKILHSMDEATFRLKKLEDEKKEKQRQKKEEDFLKKLDRDRLITNAVSLKQ